MRLRGISRSLLGGSVLVTYVLLYSVGLTSEWGVWAFLVLFVVTLVDFVDMFRYMRRRWSRKDYGDTK